MSFLHFDNFRQWLYDNRERIEAVRGKGAPTFAPYMLKDAVRTTIVADAADIAGVIEEIQVNTAK